MGASLPVVQLGFIGLGAMGGPMSGRLIAAGCEVIVFDLLADAVSTAVRNGARATDGPHTVGAQADVVFLSLPSSRHVENAVLGPGGCAEAMRPGSAIVDLSSSRPSSTRAISATLAERNIDYLDAPVSRGVRAARTGTLSMMVGGNPSAFGRLEPLLRILASEVFYIGASGTGHVVKAVNNLLSATNLVAGLEASLIATGLGLDAARFIAIVNAGHGWSNTTEERFPKYILPRRFESNFALGLMYKDIQIALELAHEADVTVMVTELTRQIYALAMTAGLAKVDNQEIAVFVERLLGESLTQRS